MLWLLLAPCFICSKCNKEDVLPEYYFRCKIDSQDYRPNSCANCMKAQILRDTVLLLNGNAGFQSVGLGLYDGDGVEAKSYILNGKVSGSADYKNSTTVDDIFKTDSLRTGQLTITSVDKLNRVVSGTFNFKGYNPVQDKTVNITEGKFRLQYVDYY